MTTVAAPPLSYSSATTLQECEQRYVHHKIAKTPPDPDYEKSDALAVGSAFHWILEKSLHQKPKSITDDLKVCVADPNIGLAEEDVPLVHAMVLKYLRLHQRMGLRVLAVEIEIKTEQVHGFIDAVMEDGDGNFWIVDQKAFKTLQPANVKQLAKDGQLNTYAAHAAYVADLLGLLPEKFAGVRWRVCTKTTAKQKKNETYLDYVKRLVDEHVKAYDIPVPKALLSPEERMKEHARLWERSAELRADPSRATKNYKSCFNYFSPCQFWSRCMGAAFSDRETLNVTVEE